MGERQKHSNPGRVFCKTSIVVATMAAVIFPLLGIPSLVFILLAYADFPRDQDASRYKKTRSNILGILGIFTGIGLIAGLLIFVMKDFDYFKTVMGL